MMIRVGTDRSRIEVAQRCARLRWLEYHEQGTGIGPVKKALPLVVGGSVHVGLATLLALAQPSFARGSFDHDRGSIEERAVAAALADFSGHKDALDVGGEATVPLGGGLDASGDNMSDFGAIVETKAAVTVGVAPNAYDAFLAKEQAALVEAMVRAYARRRLRPLLEEFEVLEVEREGEWELASWDICVRCKGKVHWSEEAEGDEVPHNVFTCSACGYSLSENGGKCELMFLSRPDAVLRHRGDGHLEILSYKTTGAWDQRKERDALRDMQGLSEGVEVERRLGQRILAIRYEYLLKGERWRDKRLAAETGLDWARTQKSHLIRQYVAVSTPSKGKSAGAFGVGDVCWSFDYHQEDGAASKLAWQNWDSRPVWEQPGGVKAWIDLLDASAVTMSGEDSTVGMAPREMGWSGPAQAVGLTARHPLDAVFVAPMTVYRNDDDLRDMVEQVEAQEVGIAEAVAVVGGAGNEDQRRSLLNRHFPQTRRACEYPATCAMTRICWGGEEIRRDPVATGLFVPRVPNHPREAEYGRE